jgi:hypothetical protein
MTSPADITVIIPAHSWPQYFEEALASVRTQTVRPSVILVAFDGVEPYDFPNNPVGGTITREIWSETNVGIAHIMNKAVAAVGTEWFLRLDEDDILHPRCVELMLKSAELCPERDIHYSDWMKAGTWRGEVSVPDYYYERLLLGPFMTSSSLTRKSVWQDVLDHNGHGWDPEMRGWEDYLFYLEAGALGHRGARVGQALIMYRRHGESTSDRAHENLEWNVAHMREKLDRLYGVELKYGSNS